ncbi:hypothetical protein NHX12_019501 [Muraenolepis orangiensis]|uniref:Tubulin polyglutamylase complex subunit 1-like C-terminal domain-containing protein n=1 Tax=Muraenolepis orangiensis TaxID=630683 RepID=A0A9Q0ETR7_9TELE|nr:hypothetical protein NHX12_019501 [Muraenolepis orangiensis]
MAEKRRSGVVGTTTTTTMTSSSSSSVPPEAKASRSESDRLLLSQLGVGELLRGAILKMVEVRSDDPIGFLADHFCNLASVSSPPPPPETSGRTDPPPGSAFSNNVLVAFDLLSDAAPPPSPPGGVAPEGPTEDGGSGTAAVGPGASGSGVRGRLYTQTLRCLCGEGGVPAATSAPLVSRLRCRDHEAVPYDIFRQGVLTCAAFSDFIRQAQRLYAEVCCPAEGPASRALCGAVLGTLREALETSRGGGEARRPTDAGVGPGGPEANLKASHYLEASAKISPDKVAQVMARGAAAEGAGGEMDAKEFENAAAELFIARGGLGGLAMHGVLSGSVICYCV